MKPSYRIQFFGSHTGEWQQSNDYKGEYSDIESASRDAKHGLLHNRLNYRVVSTLGEVVYPYQTPIEPNTEPNTESIVPEKQEPTPDAIEELEALAGFLYKLRVKRIQERASEGAYNMGVVTGLDIAREAIIARLEELGVK